MRRIALLLSLALLVPATASAQGVAMTPAARDTEPVVLTGKDLGGWAAPANQTAKLPLMDLQECETKVDPSKAQQGITDDGASGATAAFSREEGCHNSYSKPEVDTGNALGDGTPTNRLLGFRINRNGRWQEVPFQVDEQFTRYLDNSASGFSPYSGQDQHTTYAYDREGFRFRAEDPANPCIAKPDSPVATDPVKGLDTNDELAFMAADAGPKANAAQLATPPKHVTALKQIAVTDPTNPSAPTTYLYVGRTDGKRTSAFTADNGYVHYKRDANADVYELSQSTYKDYGNAPVGMTCDADGNPTGTEVAGARATTPPSAPTATASATTAAGS